MTNILSSRNALVCVVVFFQLGLSGCGGYGSQVQHGNIEVYYTEGATKAEADRLGAYLLKNWGGTGGKRSVQLKKSGDGYVFRMVIKKEFQNDENTLKKTQFDGARISRDVLDGAAVEVHACDETFNTVKALPHRPDMRYGVVEGNAEVFYATTSDKEDANRLAKYLANLVGNAPGMITFKLARRDKVVEVYMVVAPEKLQEPGLLQALQEDRNSIAINVFNNAPVELHLCDEVLNVIQVLRP